MHPAPVVPVEYGGGSRYPEYYFSAGPVDMDILRPRRVPSEDIPEIVAVGIRRSLPLGDPSGKMRGGAPPHLIGCVSRMELPQLRIFSGGEPGIPGGPGYTWLAFGRYFI